MTAPEQAVVPASLRRLPQWVVYRREQNEQGKFTKRPYQPHNPDRLASSTNAATWASFYDACAAVRNYGNHLDGIGFVFTKDDPYCGIDLDHCIGADGELTPFAESVLAMLDSYAEYSPSGDGIHIITKAEVPQGKKNHRCEVYSSGRYFTVTGRHVPDAPVTTNARQDEVMQLWESEFPQAQQEVVERPVEPVRVDDRDLLNKARSAKNGALFTALFDRGDYETSQSEADLALCNLLAFWCGRDPARMDTLFRQSALYRRKWDERRGDRTYGQITIEKAVQGAAETFSGSGVEVSRDSIGLAGYTAPETATELLAEGDESPAPRLTGRVDLWPWIEGEQPDPEWLIEGILLPGTVTILHGEPGCGKTILALHFARQMVQDGRNVLLIDEESGSQMTGSRLRAMGIGPEDAARLHYFPFTSLSLPDVPALINEVAECNPALIIFDSMADVLSASGLDENEANDVTKWMVSVAVQTSRMPIAPCVIILDHNTKDGENVKYSRGSGAKKAKADVMFLVNRTAEFDTNTMGRVRLERTKNRPGIMAENMLFVVGGEDGRLIVEQFDAAKHETFAANTLDMKALNAIQEMGETGMGRLQLEGVLGLRETATQATLNRLEKAGYIERRGIARNMRWVCINPPAGDSYPPAGDSQ